MMPAELADMISIAIVIDRSPAVGAFKAIHDPFTGCHVPPNAAATVRTPNRAAPFDELTRSRLMKRNSHQMNIPPSATNPRYPNLSARNPQNIVKKSPMEGPIDIIAFALSRPKPQLPTNRGPYAISADIGERPATVAMM